MKLQLRWLLGTTFLVAQLLASTGCLAQDAKQSLQECHDCPAVAIFPSGSLTGYPRDRVSHDMEPLPQAALSSSNTAISSPLKGWMDDYAKLLPDQNSLLLMDGEGGLRSWSAHHDTLLNACRSAPSDCAPVLQKQFDILGREFQKDKPGHDQILRKLIVASAMTDLCTLPFDLGLGMYTFNLDMGMRCINPDMITWVSAGWLKLGYEHQFLAYADLDQAMRRNKRSFLESNQTILSRAEAEEQLRSLERDNGMGDKNAYAFELRDSLSGANAQWVMLLVKHLMQSDYQGMLVAMTNLARLTAQQGQMERAEQWRQYGQTLLAEHPDLSGSNLCLLQSQRFSMDVDISSKANSTFDGPQNLQKLIGLGCPFTEQALHFALAALKPQPEKAQDALQHALVACEQFDDCGHSRKQQIKSLIEITQGQQPALLREARYWQTRLKQEILLSTERQIVWALADQLRTTGSMADAATLYQALDDQIELARRQMDNNPADFARYDELKHMRVRSDLEQGTQISLMQSENLRGQSLLRRLRAQRWFKELAGENDAEGNAELDRQMSAIQSARQTLDRLSPDAPPLIRAVIESMQEDFGDLENFQRDLYLGKLAAKHRKDKWSTPLQALMQYQNFEDQAADSAFSKHAIDNDEAYLSWLQVPGGYIGSLLAVDQMDHGPMSLPMKPKIRQQLFIPFTAQDESVLQLYRDLLKSGTSFSRSAKLSEPPDADKAGLLLNGLPIWQLADGSLIPSRTAPAGGKRIQSLSNLSDALYERLLAPFSDQYQGAKRLIISPDGPLSYLPFETLTHQGTSVIESIDIGYVQSLAVYAELKKRSATKSRQSKTNLLSVADPLYGTTISRTEGLQLNSLRRMEGLAWPSLPGTRKESTAMTSLYPNNLQLLGGKASKSSLQELQSKKRLKDFQILHFATHGYVDDEHSALVLSPNQSPISAYLMDQDIVGWDLDSDLVLLSACNTGIGHYQQGEGLVGLPYAFFMAGNRNTLMSLWPVDDAGTATLIPVFMKRIQQGEDYIAALNNTKRAFARGDYGQALSNPRVWSAFVMYGVPIQ